MNLTADGLATLAGILLTLAFSYIPGLNTKYAALSKEYQRLIMLGALVLAALLIGGLSCIHFIDVIECTWIGWKQVIEALVVAIIANQSIYAISPKLPAVKAVKASRAND